MAGTISRTTYSPVRPHASAPDQIRREERAATIAIRATKTTVLVWPVPKSSVRSESSAARQVPKATATAQVPIGNRSPARERAPGAAGAAPAVAAAGAGAGAGSRAATGASRSQSR